MSMTANNGPHEITVAPPDENGILHIDCQTCPWETTATDPMFVDSIVMRHGVITGTIRLK